MPALASDLRGKLERTVIEARDVAGARAALEALAVHHHEPYPHQKPGAEDAERPLDERNVENNKRSERMAR